MVLRRKDEFQPVTSFDLGHLSQRVLETEGFELHLTTVALLFVALFFGQARRGLFSSTEGQPKQRNRFSVSNRRAIAACHADAEKMSRARTTSGGFSVGGILILGKQHVLEMKCRIRGTRCSPLFNNRTATDFVACANTCATAWSASQDLLGVLGLIGFAQFCGAVFSGVDQHHHITGSHPCSLHNGELPAAKTQPCFC